MIQDIIKIERGKRDMSQKDLSKIIGVSQQTIGSWETGRTSPDLLMLVKLAELFHVTTDYLLGRTDDARPLEALFAPPAAPASTPPLSPQDQELLHKYHTLTPNSRAAVDAVLDTCYNNDKPKTEDAAT